MSVTMSVQVTAKQLEVAERFVERAHANGGLADVDLEQFWADQEVARADPFGAHIPQVAFGAILNWECVFAELGIPQDWRRYEHDVEWRMGLNRAYNDKAEEIVGRRLLDESPPPPAPATAPRELFDIFEMENVWDDTSQSWWLKEAAHTESELEGLLDRVEKRLENLEAFLIPDDMTDPPPLYGGQRGPVTFATSLYGPENLIFLILDNPALAGRLRDAILRAMLEKIRIHAERAGKEPCGFRFADDNCTLLTPEMYAFFALPIVRGVWEMASPRPGDMRHQHSDSDMAHIVPVLAECNLTETNFGPNVMPDFIRQHMPGAVIFGELAPFTYSRNEEVNMVAEFLRDHVMTHESRGLVFSTAGSINNGSRLSGMRLLMAAIQTFGRFDE